MKRGVFDPLAKGREWFHAPESDGGDLRGFVARRHVCV